MKKYDKSTKVKLFKEKSEHTLEGLINQFIVGRDIIDISYRPTDRYYEAMVVYNDSIAVIPDRDDEEKIR